MSTKGATKFLKTIAPDFAWVTSRDLYNMFLCIKPDAEYHAFMAMVYRMALSGILETRRMPQETSKTQYKRAV